MKIMYIVLLISIISSLTGCTSVPSGTVNKVGLLLTDTVNDQGWNSKGYEGLLNINSEFNVDIYYEEEVETEVEIRKTVEEYSQEGVNLIFGHGRSYNEPFMKLKEEYPHIHFVGFNGEVNGENITSLNFKAHSMGFFGGMIAGAMSQTNQIGVIAAFPWQPEVNGFIEGVSKQNEEANVVVEYVAGWGNNKSEIDLAIEIFHDMKNSGVDVFYPTGDGYHVAVVEEIKKAGLYAVGFIGDQSDLGESTILTSTIQNVDTLYTDIYDKFSRGELESGNLYYDFDNKVVSLGEYGTNVPLELQETVNEAIEEYINTGILPR